MTGKLWGELPIYLYGLAGGVFCLLLWNAYDVSFGLGSILTNTKLFLAAAIVLATIGLFRDLVRHKPASPIEFIKAQYLSRPSLVHLSLALPLIVLAIVIIPAFSSVKSMIPLFTEYTWDQTFIELDRAIFFGTDPWLLLQPVLGYPVITAGVAVIYHLWMLLLYPGVLWFAMSKQVERDTRRKFFLTYAMAWSLVGGVLATLFASVGPVFAEPLLGITTFVAQTDYLAAANEQVPVMVVPVQEMLVERFYEAERGLGSGITAMPSMHIAICVLYWLAAREVSKPLARFFMGFLVVIWIGSVHTAYHYAVDGLLSLVAVAALWWLAGAIFKAWDRLPAPRRQATLRTNTVPAE